MNSFVFAPTAAAVTLPELKLLIANRWVASESGRTFATINPPTGEEICQVAEADAADVDSAVRAARSVYEHGPWRKMRASARGRPLYRLAELIATHAGELARLESLDNGKALSIAKAVNVAKTVACYRYFGGWADKIQGKTFAMVCSLLDCFRSLRLDDAKIPTAMQHTHQVKHSIVVALLARRRRCGPERFDKGLRCWSRRRGKASYSGGRQHAG